MAGVVPPEPAAAAAQDGDDDTPAGPQLNPVEQALLAARERLASGKSIRDTDAGDQPADEGDDDGPIETPEATPPVEDEESEEAEQDEEEQGEPAGAEGDEEGAEAGDVGDADDGEGGEEEGQPDPDLVVQIPARREGDDDLELVVEDQEMAERVRQLRNAAIRGEQLRAERARVEQDQLAIEEMEMQISTDPVGFILGNVPDEVVEVVAMSLVTQPKVWEAVQDKIDRLNDPNELRLIQAELKADRLEAQQTLRERAEVRREAKKQANLVLDGIHKMIPVTDGITESRRDTIIASVQKTVAAAVRESNLQKVNIQDLPLLAAPALRQHGIDPIAAAQALQDSESADSEPGKKRPAKKKQKTAKQLKSASDKRKKAAAGTPPGSGAPAAAPKLPAGQTIEERIKLAREKGLAALMGGK